MEQCYLDLNILEAFSDLENLLLVKILNKLFLLFCLHDELPTFSN